MIDTFDVVAGATGLGAGWYVGARRSVRRLPRWVDMRLVRFTGERPDDYVETRDTGRTHRLARVVFGKDYRYIVRHYVAGEVVEEIRYLHAHDALDRHLVIAGIEPGAYGTPGPGAEKAA